MIWELVYRLGVDVLGIWKSYTFPSPSNVIESLVILVKTNVLLVAIVDSMKRLFIGYGISLIIGTLLGLVIAKFKYLDENLTPLVLGLQTLPSVCWIPFSILWFGIDESAIIFIVAVGSTFAVTTAIESSIKNISPIYKKAAQTMGADGMKLYFSVILPAALPSIVSGLKQGWSFAWRALIAGEMISASTGLGQVLMVGRDLADISQVTAVMVVIVIIGLLLDKVLFENIEKNIRRKWGLENN